MKNSIRCFVAMAFSQRETEQLYNLSLKPTLKKLGIEPRCLSDIEHNDDLNNRIIKEILNADLTIADLTFARPSVYYEAGFAEKSMSVIYVCRKDHLKPKQGDKYGNFRVHFDLQMKNIIPWTKPNDSNFRKRLYRRISLVARPIIKAAVIQTEQDILKSDFNRLSIHSRLSELRSVVKSVAAGLRFKELNVGYWAFTRTKNNTFEIVNVFVDSKFLKSDFDRIRLRIYAVERDRERAILDENLKSKEVVIKSKLIFCSLEKLPLSRLRERFPQGSLGSLENMLVFSELEEGRDRLHPDKRISPDVRKLTEIHVIDSIPYVDDFRKSLRERLQL